MYGRDKGEFHVGYDRSPVSHLPVSHLPVSLALLARADYSFLPVRFREQTSTRHSRGVSVEAHRKWSGEKEWVNRTRPGEDN